ncbi:hypothetical protein LIPSTDRAFT_192726 [Lipomyces starkeyi NRRL Y-11557]|uniref:Uncharacterized protein n=1 Tax=Lipomyces starkeyi NRRL Y-11557 TaxID=675824 RepID=A0A1E3PWI3_LIPST|nr:hypothetical protein LIPSTDRAFT_192726 [Lipomyces starkeyi NRRL Y-11557]
MSYIRLQQKSPYPTGESTEESVNDQGTGSTKTPDAGLLFDDNQRSALTPIIEAGVSEWYWALKCDVQLWLNEFKCPWLNENPRFWISPGG